MGSFIKWLLGIIVLLVVLVLAAVVILPLVVDPNDYKAEIAAAVKDQTGRELEISQDLKLSVFPWLGIETGGVRLGNAKGFKSASFAEVKQLGLKVKLLPLLSKEFEVDTLVLNGLRLNLEKDKQGRTNWDDLAGKAGEADKGRSSAQQGPVALKIQGIQVEDSHITWDDRQTGESYELQGVSLVTGSLAAGAKVPVKAGLRLVSNKPKRTLQVRFSGDASTNAELTRYEIKGLDLELDAAGEGLPAGGASIELTADMVIDTAADTLTMSALQVSGPAMQARGDLVVSKLQSAPALKGSLSLAETNPKTLAAMFGSTLKTADPEALTRMSGELSFTHAAGATRIDPLNLSLDDSRLTGHVHILSPTGPRVRTSLKLDRIDLDRYAAGDAGAAGADTAGAPASGDPLAALRPLDLVGDFEIGEVIFAKAKMTGLKARVTSKGGVLKIDPVTAALYEGGYSANIELDARARTPKTRVVNKLTGIQVGPLLADVAGQNRLTGKGDVATDLRIAGLTEAEVRRSLTGDANFSFRDGTVKGVDLAGMIRKAGAVLGLSPSGTASGPEQTDFSELSASFKANNGVIENQDLHAKSPLLRIAGKGRIDLPKDSIDYLLTTVLVSSLEGQGGKAADKLSGVPIPVRVKGSLGNPSYKPDVEQLLKEKAVEKVKDQLQEKLEGGLQDKLKGGDLQDTIQDAIKGGGLEGLFGR